MTNPPANGAPSTGGPFCADEENWVSVEGKSFFFEPWCTELNPDGPGWIVVTFGNDQSRHRGVEVDAHEDSHVSVWIPTDGRVFWCPQGGSPNVPWENRLIEFDYYSGVFQ
jgi:hypothetical protein